MCENLIELDKAILKLLWERATRTALAIGIIFNRLRTNFSENDIDCRIHKLEKTMKMISGEYSTNFHTKLYSLTDRGTDYCQEQSWF